MPPFPRKTKRCRGRPISLLRLVPDVAASPTARTRQDRSFSRPFVEEARKRAGNDVFSASSLEETEETRKARRPFPHVAPGPAPRARRAALSVFGVIPFSRRQLRAHAGGSPERALFDSPFSFSRYPSGIPKKTGKDRLRSLSGKKGTVNREIAPKNGTAFLRLSRPEEEGFIP